MTEAQFNRYYAAYAPVITAIARKLAQRNDALMDDLVQEGMIALWKVDPAKATQNESAYIRQAIKFRMVDWMRRERPDRLQSLSAMLEHGDQVVQDEDTGDVCLVTLRDARRWPGFEAEDSRAAEIVEAAVDGNDPLDPPEVEP